MSIDRKKLVTRHNPIIRSPHPFSPLTVGNGEIAFTADVTGLQTFPGSYRSGIPLCTMAQWAWHTSPYADSRFSFDRRDFRLRSYPVGGRTVRYPTLEEGQSRAWHWLRRNPHKFHLGRIGLCLNAERGRPLALQDITSIEQKLDLWNGILESGFSVTSDVVFVRTCCHPTLDAIAVSISSRLLSDECLAIRLSFPYGSPEQEGADWNSAELHTTAIVSQTDGLTVFKRALDQDEYFVAVRHPHASCAPGRAPHEFIFTAAAGQALELAVLFSPRPITVRLPDFSETEVACRRHWNDFWNSGGAIDLAECTDRRAGELERRIILSQYLTAVQGAGSLPPQETGLTCNSWYGKFHHEMHWWHAAHFALWGRTALLERSMSWYRTLLPQARSLAVSQEYEGARWPKMTGPDGEESPSTINPLIIWQQPHIIYLAELCYRSQPSVEMLARYQELVFESARFMTSFLLHDRDADRWCLAAPIVPAQENHRPEDVFNPAFELEYWYFGLGVAAAWRHRAGLPPDPALDRARIRLAALPVLDGLYPAHELCPDTFTNYNSDHPSLLACLGMLPGERVDRQIMIRTLEKVIAVWHMDEAWGWDFPLMAMTAARLGQPETAVRLLLLDTPNNTYLPNGHNRQGTRPDLPVYLPGNGGLLSAVALMAAGWDKGPVGRAPGFPADGTWRVTAENIRPLP